MLHNSVKRARAERDITQVQLAKETGVTRQTIAFIEKGEFAPSVTLALKIAHALDMPITKLFWLEEDTA